MYKLLFGGPVIAQGLCVIGPSAEGIIRASHWGPFVQAHRVSTLLLAGPLSPCASLVASACAGCTCNNCAPRVHFCHRCVRILAI